MPKGNIDYCIDCDTRLKNTKHERHKEARCTMCGSNHISQNMGVSELTRGLEIRNSKMTPKELGMDETFEDDPVASREDAMEVGRVITQSSVNHSWGVSALAEIMAPSSPYAPKHGSATNGTRYSYKKEKA